MTALRLLALLCCILAAPGTQALETVVGGVSVTVPEPPGFVDAAQVSAELQAYGQSLASPASRVLGYLISTDDQKRLAAGEDPLFHRYYMVQVQRKVESQTLTLAQFADARAGIREMLASNVENVRTMANKALAQRPQQKLDAGAKGQIAQMRVMDLFADEPTAIGFLMATTMRRVAGGKQEDVPVVCATALVLVKGKALTLYTYLLHRSDADLAAARKASLAWMAEVEKANRTPQN